MKTDLLNTLEIIKAIAVVTDSSGLLVYASKAIDQYKELIETQMEE